MVLTVKISTNVLMVHTNAMKPRQHVKTLTVPTIAAVMPVLLMSTRPHLLKDSLSQYAMTSMNVSTSVHVTPTQLAPIILVALTAHVPTDMLVTVVS